MRVSEQYDLSKDGFVKVEELVGSEELMALRRELYRLIDGELDVGTHQRNLGVFGNITQIKTPSKHLDHLTSSDLYEGPLGLAQTWLGSDMMLAFDMIFFKPAMSRTPTPFHQDSAYWPQMPDTRALMCWIALDEANVDNGCMWFVRGSHLLPVRPHRVLDGTSGILACDGTEREAVAVPLKMGSCTFHLGKTAHYSRGNSTVDGRAALVLTFRPASMIPPS